MSATSVFENQVQTVATDRDLIGQVGRTPLLELKRIGADLGPVRLMAKCEWFNPGGSVKDRPALNMLLEGQQRGELRPGKVILDSTSGNTGIAYAMFGAALGYPVKLALPSNAGKLHKRILRAYGATILETPAAEASDGAIREARRLYAEDPDLYFFPDQYNNEANWKAHYHGTGVEILEQTDGRVTHFVAGLGTSGTFTGIARRFREHDPSIRLISVQPDTPLHALEGWKHMETSIRPGFYDPALADEDRAISTEAAQAMARRLATEEGLLVSLSAAASVAAAYRVASELDSGTVVTVMADNASKYLDHMTVFD
ncbi:MAG: cysteine synthase family protein [Phycisphaeraceae bacterium]|nr:cysteine synthase family protein [Phycisphaeraceae bacterium]